MNKVDKALIPRSCAPNRFRPLLDENVLKIHLNLVNHRQAFRRPFTH
jgi:hypothetical protein